MLIECGNPACNEVEAKTIVGGFALCKDCYYIWTETPSDLLPYFGDILEEYNSIYSEAEEKKEDHDLDQFEVIHRALNTVRGNLQAAGRAL